MAKKVIKFSEDEIDIIERALGIAHESMIEFVIAYNKKMVYVNQSNIGNADVEVDNLIDISKKFRNLQNKIKESKGV